MIDVFVNPALMAVTGSVVGTVVLKATTHFLHAHKVDKWSEANAARAFADAKTRQEKDEPLGRPRLPEDCYMFVPRIYERELVEAGVEKPENMSKCDDPTCPECKETYEAIQRVEKVRQFEAIQKKKTETLKQIQQHSEEIRQRQIADEKRRHAEKERVLYRRGGEVREKYVNGVLLQIPEGVPDYATARSDIRPGEPDFIDVIWNWTEVNGNPMYLKQVVPRFRAVKYKARSRENACECHECSDIMKDNLSYSDGSYLAKRTGKCVICWDQFIDKGYNTCEDCRALPARKTLKEEIAEEKKVIEEAKNKHDDLAKYVEYFEQEIDKINSFAPFSPDMELLRRRRY
jgi:hypothetical protein